MSEIGQTERKTQNRSIPPIESTIGIKMFTIPPVK